MTEPIDLDDIEFNCYGCRKPVPFDVTNCEECNEAALTAPADITVVVDGDLLDRLMASARAASPKNWEVWVNTHGDPVVIPAGEKGFARICDTSKAPADYGRANNAHIANADPATVEALVDHIDTLTARMEAALAPTRELEALALERFADQWDAKLHADEVLDPWLASFEAEAMRAEANLIRAGGENPCSV